MIDRDDEAEDLIALALAGHSVRLVGPRYYGKTTLLRRVLEAADHEGMATALIDFRDVLSIPEIVIRVERGYEGATRALRGRVLGHDPALDPEPVLLRLLELPAAIFERDGRRSLIVFDEIQDVLAVSGAEESIRGIRSRAISPHTRLQARLRGSWRGSSRTQGGSCPRCGPKKPRSASA